MTTITHIAGPQVNVSGRIRQRCAWCGALLLDYDLDRPFQAVYDGRCCDCGHQYRVGEQIQRVTDDDGIGYLGPCCQEDHP